jgi:hypothetical protein
MVLAVFFTTSASFRHSDLVGDWNVLFYFSFSTIFTSRELRTAQSVTFEDYGRMGTPPQNVNVVRSVPVTIVSSLAFPGATMT